MEANNQPFASIITFEQFISNKRATPQDIKIAKTTNGSIVLTMFGSPVATLKKELQGENARETAEKLKGINLCFGIPKDGTVDQKGRPSLPCAMESVSQWEEVALF